MKKIVLTILSISICFCVLAQKQKVNYLTTFDDKLIHFGFTLGINNLDFAVSHYDKIGDNPDFLEGKWNIDGEQITSNKQIRTDVARIMPGFTVAIVSSLRLTKDLNLRFQPGLSFGERRLTYNIPVFETDYLKPLSYYSVKTTFIDFPLLIKYKARRINNDRPYIIFGGAYRHDISRTGKEDLVRLKNGGFYAEVGAGWDHYFLFFRFSAELKMSFGLNNQLGNPPTEQSPYYTQAIKELRSNIFTLSFHFE